MAEQGFLLGQYHSAVIPVLWNLIDSHDTSRFLHRANGDKRKLRLAAAMEMLLPGTPFLYYGDEVREALEAETLSAKQTETYTAAVEAWVAEANVKTYLEKMN